MPIYSLSTSNLLDLAQNIVSTYSLGRRKPRIIFDKYLKPEWISISASLLKKMFFRGEQRNFCPRKLYHVDIMFDYQEKPSRWMLNGLYFESMVLGSTADGNVVTDLPRKRNGEKRIEHIRIDKQIVNARNTARKHGILIIKEGPLKNVQKHLRVGFPDYKNVKVELGLTLDLVSPLEWGGKSYQVVILDLKLAESLKTEYGEYCWGKPQYMDHTQPFVYSFFLDLPFFYWVFDYPINDPSNRFIPVNTNVNNPDPEKAVEARVRFQETHELIRKCINLLLEYTKYGWYTNPTYENCKTCPILNCLDRGKNQDI